MIPFTVLAPELETAHRRVLEAMFNQARLPWNGVVESWDEVTERFVLSVGKVALDIWHEYGLIQVGAHHGSAFKHDGRMVMVLEHPGTLMQRTLTGHTAKDGMRRDLACWSNILNFPHTSHWISTCVPCRRGRNPKVREAIHWEPRLDMVGLCDDHYRKRATFTRKPKKRVNPSSRAAQIAGQLEMIPDGQRVMVAKS